MKDFHKDLEPGDIAFQGVAWAFSYLAAKALFPERTLTGYPSGFQDAIEAVRNGSAAAAVIPVENTTHGRVADVHYLLPESGLHVVGEYYLPVDLCLAGIGARSQVRDVYSHVHALGQCRQFMRDHDMRSHAYEDTAAAAVKMAEERDNPHQAAICSKEAALQNGLNILDEDIQDKANNTTRFVVLARQSVIPPANTRCKISLWFEIKNQPAALYKALGGFATEDVNVMKLESYIDTGFNPAHFLIDIEGHPDDPRVQRGLRELEFHSKAMKMLGVYPEAEKPAQRAARPAPSRMAGLR